MRSIIFVIAVLVPAISLAQSYSIDWHTIAGGGGTSSGGRYALTGTIGQHDAADALMGGAYALTGGFWGVTSTVQTDGAPALTVALSGNSLVVSWPSSAADLVLQE